MRRQLYVLVLPETSLRQAQEGEEGGQLARADAREPGDLAAEDVNGDIRLSPRGSAFPEAIDFSLILGPLPARAWLLAGWAHRCHGNPCSSSGQ